ncbi:MAG: DRTGG domain-containing protein [Eubacteriales bacterium]|nr:DRTGG domain-containing protein [Eubacteriales bacterium]
MSKHNLQEIAQQLNFEIRVGGGLSDKVVKSGYACDMLSWVMAHARATDIWMTILNSMNVIAVAVLTECACVLLTENVDLPEDVAKRAQEKEIIVLRTPLSTYEASAKLAEFLR